MNIKYTVSLFIGLFVGLAGIAQAQTSATYLSPEEAVQLALENNLGTTIADQNVQIAQQTYQRSFFNFIPELSAAAGKNWTVDNTEFTLQDGTVREAVDARGNRLTYGFNANWLLFDGLGRFYAYDRLRYTYQASRQYQQQVQADLTADVLQAYYSHTLQQQRLQLWESTLELSQRRLQLAKDRYELGKASKQEYLSALVDYNADKAAQLNQEESLLNARYLLNRLLGRSPQHSFKTADTLTVDNQPYVNSQFGQLSANPLLRARQLELAAAELLEKEQNSLYWPTLSLNAGLNWFNQASPVGFAVTSNGNSLSYGISANWNLFGGFFTRRNVQLARLQAQVFNLSTQNIEQDLAQREADALAAYRLGEKQIRLAQESVDLARQNTALTLDRYQLGVITALELRVAQQAEQQARLSLLQAIFDLKTAEIELRRVRGEI
jgi:outer membrane protein TolC